MAGRLDRPGPGQAGGGREKAGVPPGAAAGGHFNCHPASCLGLVPRPSAFLAFRLISVLEMTAGGSPLEGYR